VSLSLAVDSLIAQYPLVIPDYEISTPESYLSLHTDLCSACHDKPNNDVERPAYDLYQQTKSIARPEMFARMLVGVRGDRVTGIDSPLTDLQILGLMRLYQSNL